MLGIKKDEWFGNEKNDILSGIVVALALIPEAIGFSLIAGLSPMVGLYASFCMTVVVAFCGGRPGMISAATGAMALLMTDLVKNYGLEYLLATTILTGILQFLFGTLGIAKLMKFIPRSVMIGFVNALAIMIFMAQLPHFKNAKSAMFIVLIITLFILYGMPRLTNAIPAPLVAIILMTLASVFLKLDIKNIGDMGRITAELPTFALPDIPLHLQTLQIIFPTALGLSIVGLIESLLTSSIIDDMTGTEGNRKREMRAQGIGNFISGFFGGMAGCAMIGQSVINVNSGGRKRLSTFTAGIILLILIIAFSDFVMQIPMAALVAVMITVSVGTFDWSSFRYIKTAPKSDVTVMLCTVVIVVLTDNLAIGVVTGVILSAIFFMVKISHIQLVERNQVIYVKGQLFFASMEDFQQKMATLLENYVSDIVTVDLSDAYIWDDSATNMLLKLKLKLAEKNKTLSLQGLNATQKELLQKSSLLPE